MGRLRHRREAAHYSRPQWPGLVLRIHGEERRASSRIDQGEREPGHRFASGYDRVWPAQMVGRQSSRARQARGPETFSPWTAEPTGTRLLLLSEAGRAHLWG